MYDCRSKEALGSAKMVFFAGFDSDNNTSIAFNGSYHSCSYQIILPSKKHFISLFQKKVAATLQ